LSSDTEDGRVAPFDEGIVGGVSFVVSSAEAGARLDRIVVQHLEAVGRRGVAELFREGKVRVDGRVAKKGDRAMAGSVATVGVASAAPIDPEPEAPLDVRLERPDVVVVSKPAGVPTAPLQPGERGTLASALLGRYPELASVGHRPREPGLLHRLDTQTSGLVVVARSAPVFERLFAALSAGRIDKRYLAVVGPGVPESAIIEVSLETDPTDPRRVRASTSARPTRHMITRVTRVRVGSRAALVEASAPRAHRHQVRAHLASIGYPIVGDATYGGAPEASLGERHALHASQVAWAGDAVVPAFTVFDPLPDVLAALVSG
jgi:23S rRNA pseudouridine1911/1915/1917 synthase